MNACRLPHVLLLAAATVAWFGCGSKELTPLELAEYHFSRPDYDQALVACRTAIAQAGSDEEKAIIYVLSGRCYLGQGHDANEQSDSARAEELFEKAIAEFTAALQLDEKHVDALHNRRLAYRLTNQQDLASEDYRLIRKLDPNYQIAYQREPDSDVRLRRPEVETRDDEQSNPDEPLVKRQPSIVLDEYEEDQGDARDEAGVDTGNGKETLRSRVSVADFEASVPDPSSPFSKWLSQRQLGPSLGRPTATFPDPSTDDSLAGLDPVPEEEGKAGENVANDAEPTDDLGRGSTGLTSPSNWPSSSQWPQFPTQHTPSLPTGIVGPGLHPPAANTQPTLPYHGMVAPTGSTGVGAEPLPNRSAPYSSQTPQALPTTGITGAFSPYRARGSSLGPYRPGIPEALRQQATQPDALKSRSNARIPQNLGPNVPKRPTSPRPTMQFQTSPRSSPSIQPSK